MNKIALQPGCTYDDYARITGQMRTPPIMKYYPGVAVPSQTYECNITLLEDEEKAFIRCFYEGVFLRPSEVKKLIRGLQRFVDTETEESVHATNVEIIKAKYIEYDEARPRPEPKRKDRPGYVYLIKSGDGLIKIGRSINPKTRIGQIKKDRDDEGLEIIHLIKSKDCCSLETTLHYQFKKQNDHGEWFQLDEDQIQLLLGVEELEAEEVEGLFSQPQTA